MKINKLQGLLLVIAGIVLLSAMCFGVVFANFAITDKVANAEEATASASNVPFVVGNSYRDVFFDTSLTVSQVDSILSTLDISGGNMYLFILLGEENCLGVFDLSQIGLGTGYLICDQDYFPIYSSVEITEDIIVSPGWNIEESYSFSDFQTCELVNNMSFMSSQPFGSEPDPPVEYDDNLDGISVGDSVLCIIPDLEFVGNEFYQDDIRTFFDIAEFSITGSSYRAFIHVDGAGASHSYSFRLYTTGSITPAYRVDLYFATVQFFGYFINSPYIPLVYEGLSDEFYDMSAEAQEECYRFLNSLNFTSDAPSVELYQDLLNRYDSLNEQYQDLLNQYNFVNIVNNIGSSVTPTIFGDYRSSRLISGMFLNDIPIYYSENTSSSTYGDILAMPLGGVYPAGTKFRFNYYMIGMGNQNTVGINGGVHVGYIDNGVLNAIFTTDDSNCWALNRSNFEIEFTLPIDTNVLYFYCENTATKAHIYLSDVNVSVLSSNVDVLIQQAFQRGVDSVNVNDIAKRAEESGYYRGLSEENPYTFRSLFGAVVDAPLDVFTQMFDFDILGVNMKGLYLSLFTLALVILVIKFALARG